MVCSPTTTAKHAVVLAQGQPFLRTSSDCISAASLCQAEAVADAAEMHARALRSQVKMLEAAQVAPPGHAHQRP
eukprot:6179877-Pleurochrysis_carterae.AAC.5